MRNIAALEAKTNYRPPEDHLDAEHEKIVVTRWYFLRDPADQELLFKSHKWLIKKVASGYRRRSYPFIPLDDLEQASQIGFLRAIDPDEEMRFDPDHESGARLCTYAPYHMKDAIISLAGGVMKQGFAGIGENIASTPFDVISASTPLDREDADGDSFGALILMIGLSENVVGGGWAAHYCAP
jgi:hypothetical protein